MNYFQSYPAIEKIKLFSARLRLIAGGEDSLADPLKAKIRSDSLRYGISKVLAHLIHGHKVHDRNVTSFLSVLHDYNLLHQTQLTLQDFSEICWIRVVSDQVILPEVVRSFIWKVGYYEKEGRPIQIPEGKEHITRCLKLYYERFYEKGRKLTRSKEDLEQKLDFLGSGEVTTGFLLEREIIEIGEEGEIIYKAHNLYAQYLINEISSIIWLHLIETLSPEKAYREFLDFILNSVERWPDKLSKYVSHNQMEQLRNAAIAYLESEKDVLYSDSEILKVWLDSPTYQHVEIDSNMPKFGLDCSTPVALIQSVNFHRFYFHDFMGYQPTRSSFDLSLRFILDCDPDSKPSLQRIVNVLTNSSRPYLVWTSYKKIKNDYPFWIPYLLTDSALLPLAFDLIDQIKIKEVFLASRLTVADGEAANQKSEMWLNLFDMLLVEFSRNVTDNNTQGELLVAILLDLVGKVFQDKSSIQNGMLEHEKFKQRYKEALKKLSKKRVELSTFGGSFGAPHLLFLIEPTLAVFLQKKLDQASPARHQIRSFQLGLLDLCIEMTRLSNIHPANGELTESQIAEIKLKTDQLLILVSVKVIEFFTDEELEVIDYWEGGLKKTRLKRTASPFGFEIIDWGYLFLHCERMGLLEKLQKVFADSLKFSVDQDHFDERNMEQFYKIKLFLRSLLIGFLEINNQKNVFQIERLPVDKTLAALERQIGELALKHSLNNLAENRIDVFTTWLDTFDRNAYYRPLVDLLFQAVNRLDLSVQEEFVNEFFKQSTDIGRMAVAINSLDSKSIANVVSERLSAIPVEKFIDSKLSTTELQQALVDLVNSEKHWEVAKPILEKLERHYNRVKVFDETAEALLFEVKLLIAYKEQDFLKLDQILVPKRNNYRSNEDNHLLNLKNFFIALFRLNVEKDYPKAIEILRSLAESNPNSIRYALYLFRAQTLKALI